jgi:hypothetical protein
MRPPICLAIATAWLSICLFGSTQLPKNNVHAKTIRPKKTMRAFSSDRELEKYLEYYQKRYDRRLEAKRAVEIDSSQATVMVTSSESITNVQHEGVDEGGIVKLHGDHLVLLRRGRLFTIDVGKGQLKPVSAVDAFGPDINPDNSWYDELLISGDTIIVIGYSYERGGTEVGLFTIDAEGNLTYRSTYHLRSNDYYSSRNYASRLIRGKLVFYSPLHISNRDNPIPSFPAFRKWRKQAQAEDFKRIVPARRVYRPAYEFNTDSLALHTITICDPTGGELRCEATTVIGPSGHSFYVSGDSVYVWTSDYPGLGQSAPVQSLLYRLPLDGSAPSGLKVSGGPVDQFSFLESVDGYLNVLVRAYGSGDAMWDSESSDGGEAALLRVSLASFSDGGEKVSPSHYRKLPTPEGYYFQNRFVGDYLLYGIGDGYARKTEDKHAVYAVRWSGGDPIEIELSHDVQRIESMGGAAVVVGAHGSDLHFSALSLGTLPRVEYDYKQSGATQGETRSHGFFYKPDGPNSGFLGLPVAKIGRGRNDDLDIESASVLYLRNDSFRLNELGELVGNPKTSSDDKCRASCVDWYGNSRPIFLQGRVFALLGYELVEGVVKDGKIQEVRRSNYAPKLN